MPALKTAWNQAATMAIALLLVGAFCRYLPAREIPPPRTDLRAVPAVDFSVLEEPVRKQLEAAQEQLRIQVGEEDRTDYELSDAYGAAGRLYHANGLESAAEACYLNASRLHPLKFSWAYLLAGLYQSAGRNAQALTWYHRCTLISQDYPALFANLGRVYLELGDNEAARLAFEKALEKNSGDATAYLGLGQVALQMEEYSIAIVQFEKALQISPGSNQLHRFLAAAYRRLGDEVGARKHENLEGPIFVRSEDPLLDSLLELNQSEVGHLYRGRKALETGDFAEAIEEFRNLVKSRPESVRGRVSLGNALARSGDLAGAAVQLLDALRLDPEASDARFDLGTIMAAQGDFDSAAVQFAMILANRSTDPEARFALAEALRRAGKPEEALQQYQRLIRDDPAHEEALLAEASLLVDLQRFVEALTRLEAAVGLLPRAGRLSNALARMLAASPDPALRNGEQALRLALTVYESRPTVDHAETVAFALAELNRCEEAAEWQAGAVKGAEEAGEAELAKRLRKRLRDYGLGPPCRP